MRRAKAQGQRVGEELYCEFLGTSGASVSPFWPLSYPLMELKE